MHGLLLNLRLALRQLRRTPGFTLTVVLTLALGIGATTAIFSLVEGVLLRPLPFHDPARLVTLNDTLEGAGMSGLQAVTIGEVTQYARGTTSFASLGAYTGNGYELSGRGEPAMINGTRMTASVFPTLGVVPVLGRVFTQQEDTGHQQVAVLSYGTWQDRYHADPNILGSKILLDRKPYEVIGIMPRNFEFPLVPGRLNRSELWVPMSFTAEELTAGAADGNWSYQMVGRLKSGITAAQAQAGRQPRGAGSDAQLSTRAEDDPYPCRGGFPQGIRCRRGPSAGPHPDSGGARSSPHRLSQRGWPSAGPRHPPPS